MKDLRKDFPILSRKVNGKRLVVLNCSSYAPIPVITLEEMQKIGSYSLVDDLKTAHDIRWGNPKVIERAKGKIATFINASSDEITFTRNATHAGNALANAISEAFLQPDDEIVTSGHEYSSSLLPIQVAAKKRQAKVKILPYHKDKLLDIDEYRSMFTGKVKVVVMNHASTFTGSVADIKTITKIAHKHGAVVIVDGCYSAPHFPIDVQDLDCDFFYFSSYKMYAPPGIGVVYGKKAMWDKIDPFVIGPLVKSYSLRESVLEETAKQSAAGFGHNFLIHALAKSLDYIEKIGGMPKVWEREKAVYEYAISELSKVDSLKILDHSPDHTPLIPFTLEDIPIWNLASFLGKEGVMIDVKDEQSIPIEMLEYYGVKRYGRISLGVHNSPKDIDRLIEAIHLARSQRKKNR